MKFDLAKEWFADRVHHEDGLDVGAGPLALQPKNTGKPATRNVSKPSKVGRKVPAVQPTSARPGIALSPRRGRNQ